MKDTQNKVGYCQLSLGLLYEDSTEYDNNREAYPISEQEISHTKNTNRFVIHEKLLEAIVEDTNIEKAIQRVVNNKGSGGVDNIVNPIFTKNAVFNFTSFVSHSLPAGTVYPLLCKMVQQY